MCSLEIEGKCKVSTTWVLKVTRVFGSVAGIKQRAITVLSQPLVIVFYPTSFPWSTVRLSLTEFSKIGLL